MCIYIYTYIHVSRQAHEYATRKTQTYHSMVGAPGVLRRCRSRRRDQNAQPEWMGIILGLNEVAHIHIHIHTHTHTRTHAVRKTASLKGYKHTNIHTYIHTPLTRPYERHARQTFSCLRRQGMNSLPLAPRVWRCKTQHFTTHITHRVIENTHTHTHTINETRTNK